MGLVFVDWLNENEDRCYPVNEAVSRFDVNGIELPNNIIVDANIALPSSAGQHVFISSVGITSGLVTVTLLAAPNGYCSQPSPSSGPTQFVPIGVVAIPRPVVLFKNYPIKAMYPGVAGWMAFGSGAVDLTSLSLRFAGPDATQLVDRAVRAYDDTPVLSLGTANSAMALTGIVGLKGNAGVVVTSKQQRSIHGVLRDVGVIALDTAQNAVSTLESFTGTCGARPQANNCTSPPVVAINNVRPDCNGNLSLEFEGEQLIGDAGTGMVIDFPIGLGQICPKSFVLALNTHDVCNPSSSSSSSYSSSSSSSSSTPYVPPPTPTYCEDFSGGFGELAPRTGLWAVESGTLVSSTGILGEQYVLDYDRTMQILSTGDTYIVTSTITPANTGAQTGHVILGWDGGFSFNFVGVCMASSPGFPNGYFYVGHRSAISVAPTLPSSDTGYNVQFRFAPSVALVPGNSFRFIVQAKKLISAVELSFSVEWNTHVDVHTVFPPSFNLSGFTGLGVVGSVTGFNDFGVNCSGSSSSL